MGSIMLIYYDKDRIVACYKFMFEEIIILLTVSHVLLLKQKNYVLFVSFNLKSKFSKNYSTTHPQTIFLNTMGQLHAALQHSTTLWNPLTINVTRPN